MLHVAFLSPLFSTSVGMHGTDPPLILGSYCIIFYMYWLIFACSMHNDYLTNCTAVAIKSRWLTNISRQSKRTSQVIQVSLAKGRRAKILVSTIQLLPTTLDLVMDVYVLAEVKKQVSLSALQKRFLSWSKSANSKSIFRILYKREGDSSPTTEQINNVSFKSACLTYMQASFLHFRQIYIYFIFWRRKW